MEGGEHRRPAHRLAVATEMEASRETFALPLPGDPDRAHGFFLSTAIGAGDAQAIEALRAAVSESDWQDGDMSLDAPGAFGWFEGEDLLAAASLTHWDESTVGPGVLSRPDRRRAGCGTAVCSAAVGWALDAGLTLTYQTLMANTGALGVARRLGFEQYASHVAVRLTPAS